MYMFHFRNDSRPSLQLLAAPSRARIRLRVVLANCEVL